MLSMNTGIYKFYVTLWWLSALLYINDAPFGSSGGPSKPPAWEKGQRRSSHLVCSLPLCIALLHHPHTTLGSTLKPYRGRGRWEGQNCLPHSIMNCPIATFLLPQELQHMGLWPPSPNGRSATAWIWWQTTITYTLKVCYAYQCPQ